MGVAGTLKAFRAAQEGHVFPWAPVCLALGIGGYFALKVEPSVAVLWGIAFVALVAGTLAVTLRIRLVSGSSVLWALCLVAAGVALAGHRAHSVGGPVLERPTYGPVAGRIVMVDQSASGLTRVTLDRVELSRLPPEAVPRRVRVSLAGDGPHTELVPGQFVGTTAYLAPVRGAAEPGGFDFRRHAWFQSLGGVGYARAPMLALAPPSRSGLAVRVTALRLAISERIQEVLPGPKGAFAAAILVGDRAGLDPESVEDLRQTNLAHLLAISGLHMGLVVGMVFAVVRYGLALVPAVALRWPIRQIAAVAAFFAATGYFFLSGGTVATERAYVMAAVALGAVLLSRRVLSLRAVALAALVVLSLRPEALLSPGFQMSFAATTALVIVFSAAGRSVMRRVPKGLRGVASLMLASSVAGLATAPIAAAHFNLFAHYGLIANLAAVPAMSFVVMPAALLGLVLLPLGLAQAPFALAGLGIGWIVTVAETVSEWEGAVRGIAAPPEWTLPSLTLLLLWIALIQGPARWAAAPACAVVMLGWNAIDRPDILIDAEGELVGIEHEDRRVLSRAKGAGFVAGVWLENDGLALSQESAAAGWADVAAGWDIHHVRGKHAARTPPRCIEGRVIVSDQRLDLPGPCLVLSSDVLRSSGSIAVWSTVDGMRVRTEQEVAGERLWTRTAYVPVVDWPETAPVRSAAVIPRPEVPQ
ncbi:ComEC/Rec2 family competence protein [Pseudaestuariivita sp.]|uniref:ComEC/Rec2 family competence protein n=1 Tax=Pseudaestuariivita sp. TaxID=2211669 RepID=UPI0040591D9A